MVSAKASQLVSGRPWFEVPRWLNFVLFQLCWFGCVLGAVWGYPYLRVYAALVISLIHLSSVVSPSKEAGWLVIAAVLGTCIDLIPLNLGAFSFNAEVLTPWGYPLWMTSLWLGFATTFRSSLLWLSRHRILSSLLGLIGGPLSYLAGERLGAISIADDRLVGLLMIALSWAVVTPVLFMISDLLNRGSLETSDTNAINDPAGKSLVISFLSLLLLVGESQGELANGNRCLWNTCVPISRIVSDVELPLRGVASFRYWGFKVYVAALYLSPEVSNVEQALGVKPLRFEIHYQRAITAEDLIKSGEDILQKNPGVSLSQYRSELNQINKLYRSVEAGDSYALTFVPGTGLTLLLNDVALGTIPGDNFARDYLGIWLSRYSLSEDFTREVSGQGS